MSHPLSENPSQFDTYLPSVNSLSHLPVVMNQQVTRRRPVLPSVINHSASAESRCGFILHQRDAFLKHEHGSAAVSFRANYSQRVTAEFTLES